MSKANDLINHYASFLPEDYFDQDDEDDEE